MSAERYRKTKDWNSTTFQEEKDILQYGLKESAVQTQETNLFALICLYEIAVQACKGRLEVSCCKWRENEETE